MWNILFNGSSALETWRWTLTDVLIHIRLYSKQYRQKRLGFTAVTSATNDGNTRLHINCQSIHISLCQNKLIYRYLNCIWKYSNYWIFPLKWTNNLLVIPFVLLFDFKEKCWKTSKNARILLPLDWTFSGLEWWILDFSKPVGQDCFRAYSEAKLVSQFMQTQFLFHKVTQNSTFFQIHIPGTL